MDCTRPERPFLSGPGGSVIGTYRPPPQHLPLSPSPAGRHLHGELHFDHWRGLCTWACWRVLPRVGWLQRGSVWRARLIWWSTTPSSQKIRTVELDSKVIKLQIVRGRDVAGRWGARSALRDPFCRPNASMGRSGRARGQDRSSLRGTRVCVQRRSGRRAGGVVWMVAGKAAF